MELLNVVHDEYKVDEGGLRVGLGEYCRAVGKTTLHGRKGLFDDMGQLLEIYFLHKLNIIIGGDL